MTIISTNQFLITKESIQGVYAYGELDILLYHSQLFVCMYVRLKNVTGNLMQKSTMLEHKLYIFISKRVSAFP